MGSFGLGPLGSAVVVVVNQFPHGGDLLVLGQRDGVTGLIFGIIAIDFPRLEGLACLGAG